MTEREPFTIYPRTLRSGKTVFYYQVYDEHGQRKPYSTGKTDRKAAMRHCMELLSSGKLIPNAGKTFSHFASTFFLYDSCPYIQSRITRGASYSRSYAKNQRSYLEKHILPSFGAFLLQAIKPAHIEAWLLVLKRNPPVSR